MTNLAQALYIESASKSLLGLSLRVQMHYMIVAFGDLYCPSLPFASRTA